MYRFHTLRSLVYGLMAMVLGAGLPDRASADFITATPYLAFDNSIPGAGTAISPFAGQNFSYFHLETFEDHLLNVPGVTFTGISGTGVTSVVVGPLNHDSVDADDGAIDGSGLRGDTFFSPIGSSGIRFDFAASALGTLPTHVGLVWTDGGFGTTVTFEAFGANGNTLGIVSAPNLGDFSIFGETAEDRFFGVRDLGGISAISIKSPGGGIEVDHLQYGLANGAVAVPEPASMALFGIGSAMFLGFARRRMASDAAANRVA